MPNRRLPFPRVRGRDRAIVDASFLSGGVVAGEGAHLRNGVIEKDLEIRPWEPIGMEPARDRKHSIVSARGIVLVPKGYRG